MDFKRYFKNIILDPRAVFLQNKGLKQTILKNTFWLTLSEGINMVLKFFLFVYIARILGAGEYGKLAFGLAFVGLFNVFADLGLSKIVNREFAKKDGTVHDFQAILALKSFLGLATMLAIFAGSFFIQTTQEIRQIIWVMGAYLLINNFFSFLYCYFRARQKMEYQSWADMLQAFLMTGLCFMVLFALPSALSLSLAYLVSAVIALVIISFFFHYKLLNLKLVLDGQVWKRYLKMSWPLALAVLLGSIYANLDSTIMGLLGQIQQIGWYNAAQKIVDLAVVPTALLSMNFLPSLSRFAAEDLAKLQKTWNYYAGVLIFLVCGVVFGGWALSTKVIDFIYNPSYFPAIPAFQILLVAGALGGLLNLFNHALFVSNRQEKIFLITLLAAVVNVVLNVILIPLYSFYGSAIAMVASFIASHLLAIYLTLKYTKIKPFNYFTLETFLAGLISALIMFTIITRPFLYHHHVLLLVALGIIIYSLGFLLFKKILSRDTILKLWYKNAR
jgi:O-antigen/teichoic acid export membrane protein